MHSSWRRRGGEASVGLFGAVLLESSASRSPERTYESPYLGLAEDEEDRQGWQPMHVCCRWDRLELAQWLHSRGVPVITGGLCYSDDRGWETGDEYDNLCATLGREPPLQPIELACQRGHLPMVQWLHSMGAPLSRSNRSAPSTMHYACANGHLEVAEWIAAHASPERRCGADCYIQLLHGWPHEDGMYPIHVACAVGRLDVVRWLLDQGVPPDAPDYANGGRPIHYAALRGHTEVAALLLSRGAKLDSGWTIEVGSVGNQSVHLACFHGHLPFVQWLHRQGANLDVLNSDQHTPLALACRGKHRAVVQWLCSHTDDSFGQLYRQAKADGTGSDAAQSDWLRWLRDRAEEEAERACAALLREVASADASCGQRRSKAKKKRSAAKSSSAASEAGRARATEPVAGSASPLGERELALVPAEAAVEDGEEAASGAGATTAAGGEGGPAEDSKAASVPTQGSAAVAPTAATSTEDGNVNCVVCWEGPKDHVFLDCGHLCACAKCASAIISRSGRCPICRSIAERAVQIFVT